MLNVCNRSVRQIIEVIEKCLYKKGVTKFITIFLIHKAHYLFFYI